MLHYASVASALVCLALALAPCKRTEVVDAFPEEFVGVGLELKLDEGFPTVVRTLPGGSADEAGVLPGDVITAVDNQPTRGRTLGDTVVRIRGRPDTQVTLDLTRDNKRIIVVVKRKAMKKKDKKTQQYHPSAKQEKAK